MNEPTIIGFDAGIEHEPVKVLTLTLDGKTFTYGAPLRGRDPLEMTLGEWRAFPVLSASAMMAELFAYRKAPRSET